MKTARRYRLGAKNRTYIAVGKQVHQLIKLYAVHHQITVAEATYHLLKLGFVGAGWIK